MNSNLNLAVKMLNDFVTTGDLAALNAVMDLVEEVNLQVAERVRQLAKKIPSGVDLYWSSEVMELVSGVLDAFDIDRAGRDAAIEGIYDATLVVID